MIDRFEGSPEDIRAEAERVLQTIVPEATCEISGEGKLILCGTVDASGKMQQFSLAIGDLDRGVLEANARTLESALIEQAPEGAFESGYRDGWGSVAGTIPMPECPTLPPPEEWSGKTAFQLGFEHGRADGVDRVKPDN